MSYSTCLQFFTELERDIGQINVSIRNMAYYFDSSFANLNLRTIHINLVAVSFLRIMPSKRFLEIMLTAFEIRLLQNTYN